MIKINTGEIPCHIFVSDVKEHSEFKTYFLDLLSRKTLSGITCPNKSQDIFNTDWHLRNSSFSDCSYLERMIPIANRHSEALSNFLGYQNPIKPLGYRVDSIEIWFQQYKKENYHNWHRHPQYTFVNIYYVDLPNNSSKTSFRYFGKEFEVDVKEGQILTFPSFLEHCSKPNMSDKIKTVISFNTD